jgi:hypothetical protein
MLGAHTAKYFSYDMVVFQLSMNCLSMISLTKVVFKKREIVSLFRGGMIRLGADAVLKLIGGDPSICV